MKKSIFVALTAAMAFAVFLTFNYHQTSDAQLAGVRAMPASMATGNCANCPASAKGTSGCPYAHKASMQGGQCPYGEACAQGASCPHANASTAGMGATSTARVVPVMETTSKNSGKNCPSCPECPAKGACADHASK